VPGGAGLRDRPAERRRAARARLRDPRAGRLRLDLAARGRRADGQPPSIRTSTTASTSP
jgi:hypothetical protein